MRYPAQSQRSQSTPFQGHVSFDGLLPNTLKDIMTTESKKTGIKIFFTFIILIGVTLLGLSLLISELSLAAIGSIVVGFAILGLKNGLKNTTRFAKTFQWYKETYRLNVDGSRVTCFSCGGARIQTRSLMNHLYHREHFCTQCGTTLYYSPEAQ